MKRQNLLPLVFLAVGAGTVYGQDAVPTTQPGLLTIYMEEVKLGMDAAHARNEAGWPVAFEKAGAPETYLALASITGTSQVWFTVPFESYAKEGESMARNEADPVLSAELARLSRSDAEYLKSMRTVQLVLPDPVRARSAVRRGREALWRGVRSPCAEHQLPGLHGDGRHVGRNLHDLQLGRGIRPVR
jgi:hypothetical protein